MEVLLQAEDMQRRSSACRSFGQVVHKCCCGQLDSEDKLFQLQSAGNLRLISLASRWRQRETERNVEQNGQTARCSPAPNATNPSRRRKSFRELHVRAFCWEGTKHVPMNAVIYEHAVANLQVCQPHYCH
eukprot:scaffold178801_cov33-Prasinocladus_malaysianus.AAC.1